MMPSLDHCMNNQSEMTTLTKTLEVFDTYKHREDKDSDEESFHLPLDDDESDSKVQEPVRNGNGAETEDDILNKFETTPAALENIDSQTEDQLLNEDEEKKESKEKPSRVEPVVENGVDAKDSTEVPTEDVKKEESSESVVKSDDAKKEKKVEKSEVPNVDIEGRSSAADASAIDDSSTKVKPEEEESTESSSPVQKESKKEAPTEESKEKEDKSSDESSKEEKSDDFPKHSEDSEDLFDISIIRDAEEDNAESAYNEAHPEDNQEEQEEFDDRTEEKMEEECSNGKENHEEEEEEEMDIDKHEDHLKNEDVDIEEASLKLDCDATKDNASDGESESNKTVAVIHEQKDSGSTGSVENSATECRLDEVTGNLVDVDGREIVSEDTLENKNNEDSTSSLKRPLEDPEDGPTKKSRTEKLSEVETKETEKPKEKLPLKTLLTLSDFMKSRKHNRRLTMHDLEEFCVQKICESIVHKSNVGDVHHVLKQQEQLIESMRKELQQLAKQARDLEIVNKKLMNDLKQQNATQKPLNPLKITRSVGLQVKFTPIFEANLKRRQLNSNAPGQKALSPQNRTARVATNSITPAVMKQVSMNQSQKSQTLPKPNTPLLSQALQNRRVGSTDPKTPNQQNRKPGDPKTSPAASVIDLTDEDDRRDKSKTPAKLVSPKNIAVPLRTTPMRVNATTGIRLATSQGKISPITSMVNSSTPQVMYVVQSSPQNVLTSSLGGPKAVVVNFQSANGVLTSTLNGSAVSVIPKQSNTIQLKTVPPPKSLQPNKALKAANKHPAPLPTPPIVRVVSEKALKPIPPKPHLTIRKTETGIILQWKMPYELDMYETIASYQLYAYQETSGMPSTDMWRKVGDVKALALPMACTLTQFADKNKYYFAVRPVDIHKRIGMFSEPEEISL